MSSIKLGFHGAAGTVTGSRFLVEHGQRRVLVDCGLFQGYKQVRERNWRPLPFSAEQLDAVLLTHAHIDHSGALPLLTRSGFRSRIHATAGTTALCKILLPDSARLQEADAAYANRKGFSRHHPALPLYTQADAEAALDCFVVEHFGKSFTPAPGFSASFTRAGHILGAASVRLEVDGVSMLFSGDLGRSNDVLMLPPVARVPSDHLVIEGTYGARRHLEGDPATALAEIIERTVARGGTVLIPAFSVGRTQALLLLLAELVDARRIPALPIYLDSPMAISATELYRKHPATHRLDPRACSRMGEVAEYVREVEGSKALDHRGDPMILISASGMATGGRVVHHLAHFVGDERHTILFAGFQAGGTRGAKLLAGERRVRIHGQWFDVHAEIANLDMLSAHADQDELVAWVRSCEQVPRRVFIVHAEPDAAEALRVRIGDELGWSCEVPDYRDLVDLS
jgi:metallo-beta-lactamase family protein